jgi:hypothetical protein
MASAFLLPSEAMRAGGDGLPPLQGVVEEKRVRQREPPGAPEGVGRLGVGANGAEALASGPGH